MDKSVRPKKKSNKFFLKNHLQKKNFQIDSKSEEKITNFIFSF
jgi:hypothetical protein